MIRSDRVRRSARSRTTTRRIAELLSILPRASPHVLLIGDDPDLTAVFQRIQPYLRTAIVPWVPDLTSDLPAAPFGTLLVKDVSHLDEGQQARLARLAAVPDIQIVSMTAAPIFPLIAAGAFHDELYYRLNMVTLDLTAYESRAHSRKGDAT